MNASGKRKKVVHKTFSRRLVKAWTRMRIPLFTIFLVMLTGFSRPKLSWYLAGVPFLLFGFFLRLVSCGSLKKDEDLATSGIYAFIRHPLYLANTFIGFGFCLMSGIKEAFLFFMVFTLMIYLPTIWLEEKVLEELFGKLYREYALKTPRFVPRKLPKDLLLPFSWEQVRVNDEPQGVLAQALLALVMLVKALV